MKKICAYCGKEFEHPRKNKIYCCVRCADNASKVSRGIEPTIDRIKICPTCGEEFKTVYKSKIYCSKKCRNESENAKKRNRRYEDKRCKHNLKEYKTIRKNNSEIKKLESEWLKRLNTVERECAICGKSFFIDNRCTNKTCSQECSKKYKNRCHDKRVPKEQMVDRDINLARLYKRDGGKCYLCGCVCDWNDRRVSKNGYEYPGDRYPTIEHMVPISRGGNHAWDNVRLACSKCNADKSDRMFPFIPIDKEFAYKEKAKGNPAKRTIQMTLDGKTVRVWESTRQIRRELGLNDGRIQDVCRGKGKTAFGYIWKYETA